MPQEKKTKVAPKKKVLDIEKAVTREEILNLENEISKIDGAFFGNTVNCPLKHSFTDGIYVREIFIPKGTILTGKIHKHEHPNFLMKGTVKIATEYDGVKILKAPLSMISKAGTKRTLIALTDLVWVTVHHNPKNKQNIDELESDIVATSYEEYDKFTEKQKKGTLKSRIFGVINKLIKL